MEIKRAGFFENPVHFDDPLRHISEIGRHRLAVNLSGTRNEFRQRRTMTDKRIEMMLIDVVPCPHVFEARSGGFAPGGSGVGPLRVERRVEINEIDRLTVETR